MRIVPLIESRFRLDGGAMFGIVPKPAWSRAFPADEDNRIRLVCRVLVVETGGRLALVDTGMGEAWSDKERGRYALEPGGGLDAALADAGLRAEEVTDVVLTHLHFDHAGGIARADGSPRFPRATHHVQARHLAWARAPSPKDAGSFRRDVLAALERVPVRELGGPGDVLPGVRVELSHGHTESLQVVWLEEGAAPPVVFAADLVPTHAHVHLPWIMAYDNHPVVTLDEKRGLFERLASRRGKLVLEHDPEIEAVTVRREGDRWVGDATSVQTV